MICEDCNVEPGGEVSIKRDGAVVWRRTLCPACFEIRRANTAAATGKTLVKKNETA